MRLSIQLFFLLAVLTTALSAQRERVYRTFKDTRVVNVHLRYPRWDRYHEHGPEN